VPQLVDAVGDFIGDLLLEHGGIDSHLVVSLPRKAAHWRVVEWASAQQPVDSIDELRDLNPDLGLPFELDDAYVNVQPLPGEKASSLVVAADRSVVEAWVEVFAIAGGTLQHLLPAQVCLMGALSEELEATAASTLVAMLQRLDEQTILTIWSQGVPEFERLLPGAMPELLPALQQSLDFYRSHHAPKASVRLLLSEPMADLEGLEQALGLEAELLDGNGFGSLALQGLAGLELAQ
jgi:Tfp pilus assembly PilM family ATPase